MATRAIATGGSCSFSRLWRAEILCEEVNDLGSLRSLAESLLLGEIDREQHADQLAICIQRQGLLGAQRACTLSSERVRRLDGRTNHHVNNGDRRRN
ncbi:hypothetical protein [Stenotrophomonas maltophilia]|uniref:hypothetical protein n=1 Tax=Stenotrophomonas maltophilia TaxID=40324 RepID=UPI0013DD0348|nr:hypothetical protein [Stenotrophomonas maltophilia]